MTGDSFGTNLQDALSRAPDSAWIRSDLALIGWGESFLIDPGTGADRFDRALRELRATAANCAFASFTFDENSPGSIVVVPRVLLRIDPAAASYVIGGPNDLPAPSADATLPPGRIVGPTPDMWVKAVQEVLSAIDDGEVEKVVLSRKLVVGLDDEVPPHLVLANLASGEPDAHTFLIDRFIGSSPELLASLSGGKVKSVSLAGSADRGDPAGMQAFESEKTAREHMLAADSVEEALLPFCTRLDRSATQVASYGDINHLSTTFVGRTHPGARVTELLAALHPTAAVAGTPTKAALELIRDLEGEDRGRYAGPVGWLTPSGEGEFAIALRCGQLDDRTATLRAGAGIVRGSDPYIELEETRIKLRPMLGALGVS
jgi:menaquinone-specific isochorismate synthase